MTHVVTDEEFRRVINAMKTRTFQKTFRCRTISEVDVARLAG